MTIRKKIIQEIYDHRGDPEGQADAIISLVLREAQGMKRTMKTKNGACLDCGADYEWCECTTYNEFADDLCKKLKGETK